MNKHNQKWPQFFSSLATNQHGFAFHFVLPVLAVVIVASIGIYMLRSSSATTAPPGTVYTLPAGAPRPTVLPAQPSSVGTGANPIVTTIPDSIWSSMQGKSWNTYVGKNSANPRCPARSTLAYMQVNYWGFDGYKHRGELVIAASKSTAYKAAFTALFNNRVPLRSMYLADRFGYSSRTGGADDYASMAADNTSAFNCRWVVGSPGRLSPHATGKAVDINTFENPYKSALGWVPNSWWATNSWVTTNDPIYTWRKSTDLVVSKMYTAGFNWTYRTDDSQHFDAR